MIDSTLIIPTEKPYNPNHVKRALLTFDKVYLFSPDDRDIIPTNMYTRLTTGMPMGVPMGPVRPLGKSDDYDNSFEKLIHEFDLAIKQESLSILKKPIEEQSMTIGGIPIPEDTPPPDFVFGNYRNLISNPEFISVVSRGIDNSLLSRSKNIETLAPAGQEDMSFELFVNGQKIIQTYRKALYDGFCSSEEERNILTRICHARLGFLIKSIGYCDMKGINAYTTDPGLAGTIQLLERNYQKIVKDAQTPENVLSKLNNLNKLENLIFSEFIDENILNSLSIKDVLEIRSKSWGKANEGKSALKNTLREIALEHTDPDSFIKTCQIEINNYLKERANYEHEVDKLKIRLLCNFGAIITGSTLGAPLLEQLIAAPSVGLMVGLGSAIAFIYGERRFPEILDILKKQEDYQSLKGYSLFKPYQTLI
jgi:hypothetical protein